MFELFGSLSWGVALIVAGLAMLVNALFGINIPIFRMLFGAAIIYAGICLIIKPFPLRGPGAHKNQRTVLWDQKTTAWESNATGYNVITSKATIDLSHYRPQQAESILELNTIFGSTELLVPAHMPLVIASQNMFSNTVFPDDSAVSFGNHTYKNKKKDPAALTIKANTVFGSLVVKNKE